MGDIHEIGERTARIEQKLDTTLDWVKDQENRVRFLENDMSKSKGFIAAVAAAFGIAGGWISKFFHN